MTVMNRANERGLADTGRLEWRDDVPTTLTARRFGRDDGDLWVATRCGVYVNALALLDKHREIVEAHPDACVIRLSVSEFDWVARAERRGRRIA